MLPVELFVSGLRGETSTVELAAWLARGGEVNARTSARHGSMTMLMAAAAGGSLPTVRLLLQGRAEVDLQDAYGASALMFAAQEGRTATALELLRAGANPQLLDEDGATPAQVAHEWRREGVVRAIEIGADAAVLLDHRRDSLSSPRVPLPGPALQPSPRPALPPVSPRAPA